MKKKISVVFAIFTAILFLLPVTAKAERLVTAKEIAGTWSGEAVLVVDTTPGGMAREHKTLSLIIEEDGTGTAKFYGMTVPINYRDGIISGEVQGGYNNSFRGTVKRDANWIIIDGEWVLQIKDVSGRLEYTWSARKEALPVAGEEPSVEDETPVLTGPGQEGEPEPAPGDEAPGDYDWNWDDIPCDCENPWEKHAGPLATAVISIIAAIAAVLGGAGGSAAGMAAGAPGGAAAIETGTMDGLDPAQETEKSSSEKKEREPADDYSPPPEAGFGGPSDNPYTSFQGGKGPGDCVRYGLPRYYINTATLNLIVQDMVFVNRGLGPEVNLVLTYNSASPAGGIFGPGWSFSYEWLLEQKGEKVCVRKGSGQVFTFTAAAGGSAEQPAEARPPAGISHRLIACGDYWLYLEKGSPIYYRFDRVPGTSLGRLTAIVDYYGNIVKLDYSRQGNLKSIADGAGRVIRFTFNKRNLCTSFALPDGRRASFSYDGQGRLAHTEDLMGISVDYEYDSTQALTRMVTGRSKRTVAFSYRQAGNQKLLHSFTDANGNTTRYELLSNSPRRVEATDPEGNKTVFQSSAGLTEAVINPLSQAAVFEYKGGLPVSYIDRNGGVTRWEYDGAGRLVKEIDPCGQGVSFAYDHNGNLLQVTDPLGGSWCYSYNDKNSLVGITSPAGRSLAISYDSRGLPVGITGFDGQKTGYDYDRYGNITAITWPGGGSTASSYDEHGYMLTAVTDELGHTTALEHDGNGRTFKYRYPDGTEKSLVYDCCYLLLGTDERGLSRGNERDANGNITRLINAATSTSELNYDRNNNLVSYQDDCGRPIVYEYDAARCLTRVINALGQNQVFGYDPAGNLTSLWVEGERQTIFQYDRCHRQISSTDPLGSIVSLERDALGREVARQGARGNTVGFSYDPDGLLEKVFHDRQEAGSYRYDSAGRLVEASDGSGSTTFEYDEEGRIRRVAYPDGLEFSCTYNAAGLVESITYPGGLVVRYTYDSRRRPAEISWKDGWVRYTYDAAGNLVRELRSNGTESSYEYDENERPAALKHSCGGEPFIERRYTRDAAGAILKEEGFQPLEPPADYDFNFSCNLADQIIGADPSSFRYDADGNLVAGPGWAADYDAENRLVQLTRGGITRRYRYNSLGHRVQTVTAGGTHRYYYDPVGNLIFETAEEGKAPRYYLYCHSRPVAVVDAENGSCFYHYDQGGNTLALTGGDGAIVAAYAYSPFGRSGSSGERLGNPFTFCGAFGVISEGEDLYYMKKRFYSAAWGRFVQKDPMGFQGGVNPYVYAANSPINFIDPDGALVVEAWLTWKAVGAVVGVVTFTVAAAKTAYSAYNTAQEYKKRNQAAEKMKDAFKEYADICQARGTSLQEKEEAYKRYEEVYKELAGHHNDMLSGAQNTVTNAVDTAVEYVTPDYLNAPLLVTNTSVGDRTPPDPCTGGGGNYFVPKMPRLPSHYWVNQ